MLGSAFLVAVLALLIEAGIGYPRFVFQAISHPVVWIGGLIGWLDAKLNKPELSDLHRRIRGAFALLFLLGVVFGAILILDFILLVACGRWLGLVVLAVFGSSLLAQRSLHAHVAAVADGLEREGLAGGRLAVSQIVGRNPAHLDAAGVVRAAIESLAENFSDGVVAPSFWGAALGLAGMAGYKVVNTADSMIGHRTEKHGAFGWASARFDDLINLPASRLAAAFILIAARFQKLDWRAGAQAVWRDAGHHRSPNAGWPEAAMAGALGIRLAGPRVYGQTLVADGWMGDGRPDATVADLRRALSLYRGACAVQIALIACGAILLNYFR
ncbi:cobalamin biosynthesis protein CobD [Acidisoma cellulosilytica]|uniref:Cobalamin biosynthesis protein CobD n=1 Tax=Acidisoma cellulosilyticum TaxID=2802395 RepID=A0A963YXV5_9PROT|nr:adenosylcobinamide-phosphate synthase CbiB [Acidisoma cellulosilyticum]MCB8879124.1 cobalamin biosynthesis protein CobD [Acidisoma cellulosilyticum]